MFSYSRVLAPLQKLIHVPCDTELQYELLKDEWVIEMIICKLDCSLVIGEKEYSVDV